MLAGKVDMELSSTIHTQQEQNLMEIPFQPKADKPAGQEPVTTEKPKEEPKVEPKAEPKPVEPVVKQPQTQQEWDKARQFQDELRAANRKLKERETELSELRAFKATIEAEKNKLPEDASVEDVILKVNDLQKTIADKELELLKMKEDRDQTGRQAEEAANNESGEKVLKDMFDRMNAEYGPQYANKASEQLEKAWEDSRYSKRGADGDYVYPVEQRQAFVETTLEKIYLKLSKQQKVEPQKADTKPVIPDVTGSGASKPEGELKDPGPDATQDEVKAWLAKKYSKK